ncbi:hypothetical protein [Streptomyces sp. NBC_01361]|uniref:hypothetical protein n=1 Tax=Streptomyces sp. NBC_01361 TaxID=2903838 RepID=UPI002E36BC7A|nr:hypothetical protein [Streptomyces sp. NBC_01361]
MAHATHLGRSASARGLSFAILPAMQAAGSWSGQGHQGARLTGAAVMVLAFLMSLLIARPVDAETPESVSPVRTLRDP